MKTSYIAIGVVVLALVGGGFLMLNNSNSSTTENQVATQPTTAQNESENSQPAQTDNSSLVQRYVDYSESNLANATENDGKAVLFFAALAWCPSCQAADRDFKANFGKVPEDVSILKVDYDRDTAMKQKYAITMQDTFIQVDSKGQEITRWNSGGQGIKAMLANLN